jgi:hypothetical protein
LPSRSRRRTFRALKDLALPKGTCFVLTEDGEKALAAAATVEVAFDGAPDGSGSPPPAVPHWDGERRQLWWQGRLLKEFRAPAANQETVLAALEEEGWPGRIDDPLPPIPDVDPKARLHDTIKGLNRRHLHRAIVFRGDGCGLGVRWVRAELQRTAPPDLPQAVP